MGIENKKEDEMDKLDKQKQEKETKESLLNFGRNEDLDNKFLNNPNSGKQAVSAIQDDLKEKSKEINDPKTKAKLDALTQDMDSYTKLGKLNKEQAEKLSEIFKKVNSVESTEHAEDAQSGEEAQKSIDEKNQANAIKLTEATEMLKELLNNHHEDAQAKVKADLEKSKQARNTPQEQPPSLEDFPSGLKESTETPKEA